VRLASEIAWTLTQARLDRNHNVDTTKFRERSKELGASLPKLAQLAPGVADAVLAPVTGVLRSYARERAREQELRAGEARDVLVSDSIALRKALAIHFENALGSRRAVIESFPPRFRAALAVAHLDLLRPSLTAAWARETAPRWAESAAPRDPLLAAAVLALALHLCTEGRPEGDPNDELRQVEHGSLVGKLFVAEARGPGDDDPWCDFLDRSLDRSLASAAGRVKSDDALERELAASRRVLEGYRLDPARAADQQLDAHRRADAKRLLLLLFTANRLPEVDDLLLDALEKDALGAEALRRRGEPQKALDYLGGLTFDNFSTEERNAARVVRALSHADLGRRDDAYRWLDKPGQNKLGDGESLGFPDLDGRPFDMGRVREHVAAKVGRP
jgi:hypothetical protein